ncbi:MAG: HIRAN domain-containing protein [Anaerolineae bacterium]|nr:HIRAN domain-containing protein [Anaerolineae bacterium]
MLLRREPTNQYDGNAIRVERFSGDQVGYIPKDMARQLAATLDALGRNVYAEVTAIVGGKCPGSSLGVRILFTLPDTASVSASPTIDGFTADDF